MKKSLIFIILALAMLCFSAVSAEDNITGDADVMLADEEISYPAGDASNSTEDASLQDSEFSANETTGYEQFSTKFTAILTSNGTALPSKPVLITLNNVSYSEITDSAGQVTLNVELVQGTYTAMFFFFGDENYAASNGTANITVKSPSKTTLTLADKDISYRQGSKTAFIVRLKTSSGAAVKNQEVRFATGGKLYRAVTDSKGYATVYLSLKKGTRKITFAFKGNSPYLASNGTAKVKVKSAIPKGNGYWLWGGSMYKVNLKTLKNKGTKHLFLHSYAISLYGKSKVTSWIAKAKSYGINVHIWMQVFYDGKWVRPLNDDGSFKYGYMNKKINLAKTYAKMKGVYGVHMDYTRFGGTAHKYDNSVKVINYFIKKACVEVRKVRPNCVMSSAVMPEPDMMEYYYGQDISTMSKYLDVIVPMAYKGNYHETTSWIKSVTNAFVKQSNGAQIWTGLQAYQSDDNVKKLSYSQLLKDARAAMNGGANGVFLFRIGITNLLNFNKV